MFFSWTSRERSEDANSNGETTGNGQSHEPDPHQSAGRYYSRLSLTLATAFCIVATELGFDVIFNADTPHYTQRFIYVVPC